MNCCELSARIKSWGNEFTQISGVNVALPDRFCQFLASRIAECQDITQSDDILTLRKMGRKTLVRVVGVAHGKVRYEHADGSVGFGLANPTDFDDRSKLTEALERLKNDGMI